MNKYSIKKTIHEFQGQILRYENDVEMYQRAIDSFMKSEHLTKSEYHKKLIRQNEILRDIALLHIEYNLTQIERLNEEFKSTLN